MLKTTVGLFIPFLLFGCSSTSSSPVNIDSVKVKNHTLAPDHGKTFSFKSYGCIVKDGSLKNEAAFASAGSYGTLIASNSKSSSAVDQYHVSCDASPAGGKSSCVIQHIGGNSRAKDYGGSNCPDIKFKLINFKSF